MLLHQVRTSFSAATMSEQLLHISRSFLIQVCSPLQSLIPTLVYKKEMKIHAPLHLMQEANTMRKYHFVSILVTVSVILYFYAFGPLWAISLSAKQEHFPRPPSSAPPYTMDLHRSSPCPSNDAKVPVEEEMVEMVVEKVMNKFVTSSKAGWRKPDTETRLRKQQKKQWLSLQESISDLSTHFDTLQPNALEHFSVCFVTSGILGPVKAGGVAVMTYRHAKLYQEFGANVSVLFTGFIKREEASHWREEFAKEEIDFFHIPVGSASSRSGSVRMKRSHDLYAHLAAFEDDGNHFDLIVFHDLYGLPYYTLEAKANGKRFQATAMMVHAHGSTKLSNFYNGRAAADKIDGLVTYGMERHTIENADFVLSPSEFYFRWMTENGYSLVGKKYYTVYLMMPPDPFFDNRQAFGTVVHSNRFAFFGRMDRLKGTLTFLDALDVMVQEEFQPLPAEVLFIGDDINNLNVQSGPSNSYEQIRYRSREWPFNVTVVEKATSISALTKLRDEKYILVNPTHGEVSSTVTMEALAVGIPVIASNVCALPELFDDKEEFYKNSFPRGDSYGIGERMVEAMQNGVMINRRPISSEKSRELYVAAALEALRRRNEVPEPSLGKTSSPSVSIAVIVSDAGEPLSLSLSAIAELSASNLQNVVEILVASESISLRRKVARAIREFNVADGMKTMRAKIPESVGSISPLSARNVLLNEAKGDYVLFVRSGTVPTEESISLLVESLQRRNAGLAMGFTRAESVGKSSGSTRKPYTKLCVGSGTESLLYRDNLCSSLMLANRTTLIAIGAFTAETDTTISGAFADWNMHIKMALGGLRTVIVPEVLSLVDYDVAAKASTLGEDEQYYGHYTRASAICEKMAVDPTVCTPLIFGVEMLSDMVSLPS